MNFSLFKAVALQLQLQLLLEKLFDSPFTWRKVKFKAENDVGSFYLTRRFLSIVTHGQHILTLLSYR